MAFKYILLCTAASLALTACGKSGQVEPEALSDTSIESEETARGEAASDEIVPSMEELAASQAEAQIKAEADFEKAKAENLVASREFLSANAKKEGVVTTDSGLQYLVLGEGPDGGVSPNGADLVQVDYVGTQIDGKEFDSSAKRGAAAQFRLDQIGQDMPGWAEGLALMSEGDRYRLFIPADLAFGESGTRGGPIGPNEALIFDVELLKVQNPDLNLAAANEFLAANGSKEGVLTTPSGLQYMVLSRGPEDGVSPTEVDVVKVHYKGELLNGTEFDSSYARNEPAEFPLGRVIAGWTEGVQLMNPGDKFRFFVPPALGYGEAGTPGGPIGPNEALIFDVELLEVK